MRGNACLKLEGLEGRWIHESIQLVAADVRRLNSKKPRDQSLLTSAATILESVLGWRA